MCRVSQRRAIAHLPASPAPSLPTSPPLAHRQRLTLTPDFSDNPITGRAHLLDIPRYLASEGKPPLQPFSRETPVTLEMLQGCAKAQGTEFAIGDILVVRTGLTEELKKLSQEEHDAMIKAAKGWVGVNQGEDILRWHWENGFAAVATDT